MLRRGNKTTLHFAMFAVRLLGLIIMLLVFAGLVYEEVGAWRDGRILKQIGRSVDIGGRALNIYCGGEGSPTVIFVSGRDSPGYVWMPSERGVSTFTRACWYDRANLGWSGSGPDPSWGQQSAEDLHQLLRNAGIKPPFVMVGASFGGYIIRLYNHRYPGEVTGMVFADTALEDAGTIRGMPHRDPLPLPRSLIRGLSIVLGRLGMMRFLARNPGPPKGWRPVEWDILARLERQRNVLLADAQEGPERATADQVRSVGGLENMPMIVLTQARPIRDANSPEAHVRNGWLDLQRRFAEQSHRGSQVLVTSSGHGIPIEAPDAVITAVDEIVNSVRGQAPKS